MEILFLPVVILAAFPGAALMPGALLARGISDDHDNFVHLMHPIVGDCHEIEKSASSSTLAREAWQECFEYLSTWIPKD